VGYLIWDFDGTLATRDGGWAGTVCEVLAGADASHSVDPEAVDLTPLFRGAFTALCGIAEDEAHRLASRVREIYLRPEAWRLYEDVVPTLEALGSRGWKHVVLSNHVPELDAIVETLGLAGAFERVYSSGCTGAEKPNPAAFERVFADFPAAREGWMIGDNPVADVQGGEGVGLRAILVRGEHPEARFQCGSLHEVPDVVGVPPRPSAGLSG
jgi:putative hydrolase of the HAD superfamily